MSTGLVGKRVQDLVAEHDRRATEMLRVFRPMPHQIRIFTSQAPELIVRGGNRSGKTTATSVLFASLALNRPIYGIDDKPLPRPWPNHWGRDNLLLWIVGYDEKHIGQTMYTHLFKPGLFRIIRDRITGKFRTFRPWDQADQDREDEAVDSEPLIPERFVANWAWKDRARNIFETCELHNGTVIRAYSSRSNPKQGDKVHCIWIDEDIEYESHVAEWRMRLLDHHGRLIWSAYPHSSNQALVDMSDQAADQKHWETPIVEEIQVSMLDNVYIADSQKKRAGILLGEGDESKARIHGDFTHSSYFVYPSYSKRIHLSPCNNKEEYDEIDAVLEKNERPRDWTRFLAIDPGFTKTAVLFGAVPPPDQFDLLEPDEQYLIIEDEIYEGRKTIAEIAKQIKTRTDGFIYQAFVIDWHAARQTPMSGGKTIGEQFREEFMRNNIVSEMTGNGFMHGNDDILGRIELVRKYLAINRLGKPRLRMHASRTPGMQLEFLRYKFRAGKNGFIDEKPVNRYDHAMDALGYLVSIKPEYTFVDYSSRAGSPAYHAFQRMMKRQKERTNQGSRFVNLGPPT